MNIFRQFFSTQSSLLKNGYFQKERSVILNKDTAILNDSYLLNSALVGSRNSALHINVLISVSCDVY